MVRSPHSTRTLPQKGSIWYGRNALPNILVVEYGTNNQPQVLGILEDDLKKKLECKKHPTQRHP